MSLLNLNQDNNKEWEENNSENGHGGFTDKNNASNRLAKENENIDGLKLYEDIVDLIQSHVYFSNVRYAKVSAIWALTSQFVNEVDIAPLLIVSSSTKRCGKTTLLAILNEIALNALRTSEITMATLMRISSSYEKRTLLIDEGEGLGRKVHRDLLAALNASYRRGTKVYRCSGKHSVVTYDGFGFRVVAAVGVIAATLMDRGIHIRMVRRPANVKLERFDAQRISEQGAEIRKRIGKWVSQIREKVRELQNSSPKPEELNDRSCDNWSPIFAVAKAIGDCVLDEMVRLAVVLEKEGETPDEGELLLRDIKRVFEDLNGQEKISSKVLLIHLHEIETSAWGSSRGGVLNLYGLAKLLKEFGIYPKPFEMGYEKVTGYYLSDFLPAFDRYLRK